MYIPPVKVERHLIPVEKVMVRVTSTVAATSSPVGQTVGARYPLGWLMAVAAHSTMKNEALTKIAPSGLLPSGNGNSP